MNFLDELYYGNINPNENRNRKTLPYEKAVRTFSDIENKLSKELNGDNLKLFNELVNASDEISATSGVENFKMGFRLGVMMMCDSLLFDNSIIRKLKTMKASGRLFLTRRKPLLTRTLSTEYRNSETAGEEILQQAEQVFFQDLLIVPIVVLNFIFVHQKA